MCPVSCTVGSRSIYAKCVCVCVGVGEGSGVVERVQERRRERYSHYTK